jgi:NADH-quinone oxidoreductase subunit J
LSIWGQNFPYTGNLSNLPTTETIGRLLLQKYVLPFEVASVLLLVALIGAAYLARKEVK